MAIDEVIKRGSSVIDHNYMLYLHPSDTSNALSLGFQLIGIEKYTIWRQPIEVFLLIHNKLGFVDGSIIRNTYGEKHVNL